MSSDTRAMSPDTRAMSSDTRAVSSDTRAMPTSNDRTAAYINVIAGAILSMILADVTIPSYIRVDWLIRFECLLVFVDRFRNRARQGTDAWIKKRQKTVGASELGGLLGLTPSYYSDRGPGGLAARKAGLQGIPGAYLNWYCVFGTMFEEALTATVEVDLGTPIIGDTINVPSPYIGHANSPDGFGVVWLVRRSVARTPAEAALVRSPAVRDIGAAVSVLPIEHAAELVNAVAGENTDDGWDIWTTDRGVPPPHAIPVPVLVEFKSPPRRVPGKRNALVPPHYIPQIWSGTDLSRCAGAEMGLFIDAAFRVCRWEGLSFSRGYNTSLHKERRPAAWGDCPFALGVFGLFAREPLPIDPATGKPEVRDLGGREEDVVGGTPRQFDNVCRLIHDRTVVFRPGPVAFSDGRGATLADAAAPPESRNPEYPHLVGVIAWKLFQLEYVPVPPRDDFVTEIRPKIEEVLRTAADLRAAAEPGRAWEDIFDPAAVEARGVMDCALAGLVAAPKK